MNIALRKIAQKKVVFILFAGAVLFLVYLYSGLFQPGGKRPEPFRTGSDSLLLFAHRGLDGYFPENSLAGYRAALALGFDAIELDVRMTADSQIVIFHDANGTRLCGQDLEVSGVKADSLRKFPLLFRGIPSSSSILLLKEFFRDLPGDFPVYIDIKPIRDFRKKTVLDHILDVIKHAGAEDRVILASSNLFLLRYIRKKEPGIRTALEGFNAGKEWMYTRIPPSWRPDYLSSFSSRVDADHMAWLRKKGLLDRRIVYGVDSTNFHEIRANGLRCMIIDYGDYLNLPLGIAPEEALSILSSPPPVHEQQHETNR